MSLLELFLISVGLSMDAFAVAICKGLSMKELNIRQGVTTGIWFGFFQALMPFLGFLLGVKFSLFVKAIDHWIAFILLSYIGYNMIKESREACDINAAPGADFKSMLLLSIATSIDALIVGITFAFLYVSIIPAVSFIGITTFLISTFGVFTGYFFGSKLKTTAEIFGGIILIIIGLKILISHLIEHYFI